MVIPFTGTGITLYMTLVYTTNFTVNIDGGIPIQFLFVQPSNSSALYNFTVYNQQSLQFGNHNLDLMLLDTNETGDGAHNSNFLFDYAEVNDTTPSTGVTPSPGARKGIAVGTIVGGIVGGLTALACLCYLVRLWYLRRARSTMSYSRPRRPERNLPNLPVTTARIPSTPRQPVRVQRTLQGTSTDSPVTTSVQHRSNIIPTYMSSFLPHEPLPPCEPPPSAVSLPPSAPASLPPRADNSLATTILSNDQLNVLHRLAASNTPALVLATVAQSMVLGSPNRSSLEPVDVAPPPPYTSTADLNLLAGT
ncbi:hypothetical protein F5887DRAFT_517091 [Amanita rubescens]|nr:hypothetical protein F5887DRAFT_517091 [Amanita rubescens]